MTLSPLLATDYESLTGNSFTTSLDSARATATGDMADVLNQLDLMSLVDFKLATNDLSPYIYNSVTTASLEAAQKHFSFLRNKMKSESQNDSSPLWFTAYNCKTHYDQMGPSDEFTVQQKGNMLGGSSIYTTDFSLGGGVHNCSTSSDETIGELQSGESFSVNDRNASEDALKIGVGLKIVVSNLVHGYVDYEYTFADQQDRSHLISIGLSYKF